jgi:hypothetical protein
MNQTNNQPTHLFTNRIQTTIQILFYQTLFILFLIHYHHHYSSNPFNQFSFLFQFTCTVLSYFTTHIQQKKEHFYSMRLWSVHTITIYFRDQILYDFSLIMAHKHAQAMSIQIDCLKSHFVILHAKSVPIGFYCWYVNTCYVY